MDNWDEYFLNIAYVVARKSKDRSTQVGAVIVGPNREVRSTGYNGPCRGEADDDPTIHDRPLKYSLFEHAERNALLNSAFCGVSTAGCTMYCTWGPPCAECARAVVQSGIKQLVYHLEFPGSQGWSESTKIGYDLLTRLGVKVHAWSGTPLIREIRCGGKVHCFGEPPAISQPTRRQRVCRAIRPWVRPWF
jgi:dCMP deaminase